jgi:galactose oxidase
VNDLIPLGETPMEHLGNAWHIPGEGEPRGRGGMRDPAGALVPGMEITIFSGNQFQGAGGNPGNQLQIGSSVFFKRAADGAWTELPLIFYSQAGNNKFYSATIPAQTSSTFQVGDVIQYYLRIAYDDHDTTFLRPNGNLSVATADELAARAAPFTFVVESSALRGHWGPVLKFRNAAIHAHLLPSGRVLMWGRRDRPTQTLDEHECTPFVWDPADPTNPGDPTTAQTIDTPPPTLADGSGVNLFCSGHAFVPDGRLLVVGGHLADSNGVNQASLYDADPVSSAGLGSWTPSALMNKGRWYPTATTLPDGGVLVVAGSYKHDGAPKDAAPSHNKTPQVWRNGVWTALAEVPDNHGIFDLYPRMHVLSDGRVFMSGPMEQTYVLATDNGGQWTKVARRTLGQRDYAPAVMYDVDRIIFIGGGGGHDTPPTAEAETIDLSAAAPRWSKTDPMSFARRQHNATLLPDGTVLVTGGTRGHADDGFNDLNAGQPVHTAELWDPATGRWAKLAGEVVDRCYHATTVLLPDARVLSAGGGEYRPDHVHPNEPEDTHRDAQIFSPPYLFKGPRPVITSDPKAVVTYGEVFEVGTAQPADIAKVSWIRLASVTHSFDQNQRINFLSFQAGPATLRVTAPASPNVCPPGHYMLFIVSTAGVPSIARIVRVQPAVVPAAVAARAPERASAARSPQVPAQPYADVVSRRDGTPVVVGITGTCPYGIGACWGGAHEALGRLDGVDLVNPTPNAEDSTAEVFLQGERLPALDRWSEQFRRIVNGRYLLRGVEVTLRGVVQEQDGNLFLAGPAGRPSVQLAALGAADKIQWDHAARARRPMDEGEDLAYERLAAASRGSQAGRSLTVTGPLTQTGGEYRLHVRLFRNA